MKFECLLENLIEKVSLSEKIVGKKESLPVLSCIVLEVDKNIILKSTNLETALEIKLPGLIKEKGIIAIPAYIFSQTLTSTKGEKVTIEESEGNLIIISKSGETIIKALPHNEFPKFPKTNSKNIFKIKKDVFVNGIQNISYASSNSMIRPELASIFITYKDGQLVFVATDSFRLAEKKFNTPLKNKIPDTLIPTKNAIELVNIITASNNDEIDITFEDNQINISTDGINIISRIIDGNFPNYIEVIPKEFISEATLLKEDIGTILKKTRVFSGSSQQVGFHIYPKKKIFTITARSSDIGEMSDEIEAAVSGEDIDINFNFQYINDCVQAVKTDSISMHFAGESKPLIIKSISDPNFMYLVMPLNK
jgi:DNA polymerase III subunit beta